MEYHTKKCSHFLLVLISTRNVFGFEISKYFIVAFKNKKIVFMTFGPSSHFVWQSWPHKRGSERMDGWRKGRIWEKQRVDQGKWGSLHTQQKRSVSAWAVCPLWWLGTWSVLMAWAILVQQNGKDETELETWVPVSTLEFISCVILDNPLNFSGLQHPHLLNGEQNTMYLPGFRGGLDENCRVPHKY